MKKERKSFQRVYYGYAYKSSVQKPLIKLQGKYLQDFGFKVGDSVKIECEQGRIIITANSQN